MGLPACSINALLTDNTLFSVGLDKHQWPLLKRRQPSLRIESTIVGLCYSADGQ